jgi:catalase
MATRKSRSKAPAGTKPKITKQVGSDSAVGTTVSGPSHPTPEFTELADHATEQQTLVEGMPFNSAKPSEYGARSTAAPVEGPHQTMPSPTTGAGTLSEKNESLKTGAPTLEPQSLEGSLESKRVNSAGQMLTTNQGVPVSNNQDSLKAGLRGPTLLEDFILREKITHFDHERIPERIVHARGSAAHGFFEAYEPLSDLTRAAPFTEAGKRTPVFVRFSTVAGERGSADTARDVRGFAVKFYTDEGNWDLVGNNIPVFFIQDAIKFPDLIHAAKPEPHNQMPQAATAHDTFWDFVSLMPESTHMLMWIMSDRAIPRSYRMMQGFGVHTFRLVNAEGKSTFCKFHWKPLLGTHSLVWDEAVKIMGADPDFHRRDLWEAIESGNYPEWEFGLQTFSEADAEKLSFDVLDSTKLIPEELIPVKPVGRMVLNRNPDNFFAETEQVAFCTAHVVPGIDFSNDPLLHGRIHSYLDTQITRLGGPNFHEIPINASVVPVHNNQRDGFHRQAIARGRVAYEPNSLAGGCPFQAGAAGFTSFPKAIEPNNAPVDKVRGRPEKFAEHYAQAKLFFESQTEVEKAHIRGAFRFELSKLTVPAIRVRVLSSLLNVSKELATGLAQDLGLELPDPMPRSMKDSPKAEVSASPALSLTALPGDGNIATRKIAIVIADGVESEPITEVIEALDGVGAVTRLLGSRLGTVRSEDGEPLEIDATLENSPAVLFDALVLAGGSEAVDAMSLDGRTLEFVKDQYRHCKTILALGGSSTLLMKAGIPLTLPSGDPDPGLLIEGQEGNEANAQSFIAAIGRHRHLERDQDPPLV